MLILLTVHVVHGHYNGYLNFVKEIRGQSNFRFKGSRVQRLTGSEVQRFNVQGSDIDVAKTMLIALNI